MSLPVQTIVADFAQTFFVGSDATLGSKFVFIKNVDLYFKDKPTIAPGSTSKPGVTMYICETENIQNTSVPKLTNYVKYGIIRKTYDQITTSNTASSATSFQFRVPVPIETDKAYAIVIKFDGNSNAFSLWRNVTGETYNSKQSSPVTKGALDGQFFVLSNDKNLTPLSDNDLMFTVFAQKFATTETNYQAANRNYEFATTFKSNTVSRFIGGEAVFANTGYVSSQTVSVSSTSRNVTGTGTTFNSTYVAGQNIVINSGNTNTIRKIVSIANSSYMTIDNPTPFTNSSANYIVAPVAVVTDFNAFTGALILTGSTANATHNFLPNTTCNTVVGEFSGASAKINTLENIPLSIIEPEFKIVSPSLTYSNVSIKVSNSSYYTNTSNVEVKLYNKKALGSEKYYVSSRTNEVLNLANLSNGKSLNINVTFSSNNEFVSPLLDEEDMMFNVSSIYLNEFLENEELPNKGLAESKYVSKPVLLSTNTECNDLKVTLVSYRPANTDIHVYCRFHNKNDSTPFESRTWTKLLCVTPGSLLSSETNTNDVVELEYIVPSYPFLATNPEHSGDEIPNLFTINLEMDTDSRTFFSNNRNLSQYVDKGTIVRIYNQLFPTDSVVAPIDNYADNSFKISRKIQYLIDARNNVANPKYAIFTQGGLKVDIVKNRMNAFSDFTNDNIVSYYGNNLQLYSGFNSFQIKIVMSASLDTGNFPYVDNIIANAFSNI